MQTKDIINQAISKKLSTIILLAFATILAVLFRIFMVLVIRNLVDEVFVTTATENQNLSMSVVIFVASLLLWFFMEILIKNQSISLGMNVTTTLSKIVYACILEAEMSEIEKHQEKDIVEKISKDCEKIGNDYIGKNWISFFREMIFLVAVFITYMAINPILGLVTYATLPLYFMIVKSFKKYADRVTIKYQLGIKEREKNISETVSKIRSIKIKNGIVHEKENFQKQSENLVDLSKNVEGLQNINNKHLFELLVGLVLTLMIGLGGYFSRSTVNHIPGTIVAFIILIPFVFSSFNRLIFITISSSTIENEINSINEIINMKSELKSEPINSLEDINTLKFESVTLMNDNNGVESLNFELKRGEKLGILSIDGNSSDTIFELITKLVRPKEGIISINNCDISKLNTLYLRDIVTAIPESKQLFNNTIMYNITYPLAFDDYKYNDALNRSGLKDILVDYEEKDQTLINQESISEEMIERISIANAFYKDSKIYIINEMTSSLDIRSEEMIMKEYFKLKNKIIILMSTKIYNVINCDKVLIMDKENVVEYGKVSDLLLNRNSVFSQLTKKIKVTKSARA